MITILIIQNNRLLTHPCKVFDTDEINKDIESYLVSILMNTLFPATIVYLFNGYPIFSYITTKEEFIYTEHHAWLRDSEKLEDWFMGIVKRAKEELIQLKKRLELKKLEEERKNQVPLELQQIIDKQLELVKEEVLTKSIPKMGHQFISGNPF